MPATIPAPQELGARCDLCALFTRRAGGPVPSEINPGALCMVVGEAPGEEEVQLRAPFVGPSGAEMMRALEVCGLRRGDVHFANAMACRPPENKLDRILAELKRSNEARAKARLPPLPEPSVCCRPRLLAEIRMHGVHNLIAAGAVGYSSLLGSLERDDEGRLPSIMAARGFPVSLEFLPDGTTMDGGLDRPGGHKALLMPTIHPAFVIRQRRWTRIFRSDVARAVRNFRGQFGWREPVIDLAPPPRRVREFLLGRRHKFWVYDVETGKNGPRFDALSDILRCIGVATEEEGVVVPFLGIDHHATFYDAQDEAELRDVFCEFFSDRSRLKIGHNCLVGSARVVLADGTTEPMERLVRHRSRARVLALAADGTLAVADVVGWIRQRRTDQRWVAVGLEGQKPNSSGLTLTPEHPVRTSRGWIRADMVQVGDTMYVPEAAIPPEDLSALIGTLLGDSCLKVSPTRVGTPSPTARLTGGHTCAKLSAQKARWLSAWLVAGKPQRSRSGFAPKSMFFPLSSRGTLRQLGALLPELYDDRGRTRRLRLSALKRLGGVGLAWWFMDDGCVHRRGGQQRWPVHLAACRYPKSDRERARRWLSAQFGPVSLSANGVFYFSVAATERFVATIGCYVLPAVRYKLPKGAPSFCGYPASRSLRPLGVRVARVGPIVPAGRARAETSYCLTTTTGNFFTTQGLVKNCGYYDRMVIERAFGVTPVPVVDTMLLHHVVDSELPHSLGFVGSYMTEPPRAWKADNTAKSAKVDTDLWTYCATDCVVTARLAEPLMQAADLRRQAAVTITDHKLQAFCVGMHRAGLFVDQARRAEWDRLALSGRELPPGAGKYAKEHAQARKLLAEDAAAGRPTHMYYARSDGVIVEKGIVHYKQDCREAAGLPELLPGSYPQVRKLLFEDWALPADPDDYTETGQPSTGDAVLLKLLSRKVDASRHGFLHALRWYRRKVKERGTYIVKLKPCTEYLDPNDSDAIDETEWDGAREERKRRSVRDPPRGVVAQDGRVHPNWSAHVAVTGRLSSSDPINAQNFPKHLRDMIVAEPGNRLIGCDMDQLELRMVSALAGASRDLEIFHRITKAQKAGQKVDKLDPAQDPYSATGSEMFGPEWAVASTESKEKLRHFSKIFRLACQYGAEPPTVWDILRSSEDKHGRLVFLHFTLRQTRERYVAWVKTNPEIVKWWAEVFEEYRRKGHLIENIGGRRRDFTDGEDEVRNEVINFRGQAGSAAVVNQATLRIVNEILPFGRYGPGVIQQGHDALLAEVRAGEAERLAKEIEAAMEFDGKPYGLDVIFTATAKVGDKWSEV